MKKILWEEKRGTYLCMGKSQGRFFSMISEGREISTFEA